MGFLKKHPFVALLFAIWGVSSFFHWINDESEKERNKTEKVLVDLGTHEYRNVDLKTLLDDIDSNVIRAKDEYMDEIIETRGKLISIGSNGERLSFKPVNGGVIEYFIFDLDVLLDKKTYEKFKPFISKINIGDVLTVGFKVTYVGTHDIKGELIDISYNSKLPPYHHYAYM